MKVVLAYLKKEPSRVETKSCDRIPGASRNDTAHSGRYVYVGGPGCRLYSGGSANGGISRMEISHSGRSLLGPFRSMGTAVAELPALYAFKDLGVMDTPLGATIEPEKMDTLGGFVALISTIAILLAVTVPTSPTRDDED